MREQWQAHLGTQTFMILLLARNAHASHALYEWATMMTMRGKGTMVFNEPAHKAGFVHGCMHGDTSLSKDLVKNTRCDSTHPSKTLHAWSDHGKHLHDCHA